MGGFEAGTRNHGDLLGRTVPRDRHITEILQASKILEIFHENFRPLDSHLDILS